jgi:hypothetical protein
MKRIILSADKGLIKRARRAARVRRTTLSAAFRGWLERYVAQSRGGAAIDSLMRRLQHVSSSGTYTRDEMNER